MAKIDYEVCPICGKRGLEVDDEYMQSTYMRGWPRNKSHWTFFCPHCENANPYNMLVAQAKEREQENE